MLRENFPIIGIHEDDYDEKSNVGISIKNIIEWINKNKIYCIFQIKNEI